MAKQWKLIDWAQCPCCGSDIEVFTDLPRNYAWDGDKVHCLGKCEATGLQTTLSSDEDGTMYIGGDW